MPEIIVHGIKTNYMTIGEGHPLLILHGWGSNAERWSEVAEILSKNGFKVIIPDLPGFGKSAQLDAAWNLNSYVNWIDEFIKILNVKNIYLAGHSFGGALACKISIKRNQDIKKMFLIAPAFHREKTAQKNVSKNIAKVVKIFRFLPYYGLFRKAIYKYILRKSDYIYSQGIMQQTYLKVIDEDIAFQIPFIKVPTVIIWGDKDQSTPVKDAYYLQKEIKNAMLEIIPGAGHDLNRKEPQVLAEKIIKNS